MMLQQRQLELPVSYYTPTKGGVRRAGEGKMIDISAPVLGDNEIEAIKGVLKSGLLVQGPKVKEFEGVFASYIGTKYAVAVSSGTAALHVALLSAGVGEGDEVITTPFSFIASASSILFCRAKPVFVDIDEDTFNINCDMIERKITPKTKALLVVHLFGQPCEMAKISQICQRHGLLLIEDACQAHGAEYAGKKVGSFGIGCFSFYPTKNMTTGEGGMITTNSETIAKRARMIRNHGQDKRYFHEILGYNYRMTELAAALGVCQLKKLDKFNRKRIENAKLMTQEVGQRKGLVPPFVAPDVKHVFHQFTIRVTADFKVSRDELRARLKSRGIGAEVYYPLPIHKQPYYRKLGYKDEHLPSSEKAATEVLSLPVHPSLTTEELGYIVQTIKDI